MDENEIENETKNENVVDEIPIHRNYIERNYNVYVRHQEKQWDNNYKGLHRLDSPLTKRGLGYWKHQIVELEQKYGIPDRIVCSPFFRCRQMVEELMKVYRDVPVEIDSDCGEYLGHQKLKFINNRLLRNDTLIYRIVYKEDVEGLKQRAKKVYDKYRKMSGYTLIITHGFLMYHIATYDDELEEVSRSRKFNEGDSLIIPLGFKRKDLDVDIRRVQ